MDFQRALAAFQAGDLDLAEPLLRAGLAAEPSSLRHKHVLSAVLMGLGRYREALPLAEAAHAGAPDDLFAQLILGKIRLGAGDYRGGWPMYEARLRLPTHATEVPPIPVWRGEPLAGKTIVVWREQGFGDMIMCLRFLPALRELGARVMAVTRPALVRLYASLGFDTYAHGGEAGSFPALPVTPDFHTHPFSIPRWLGITVDSISGAPYLSAEPRRFGRIGVVWRGRPSHQYDRFRSLPADLGARLLALPGAVDLEPSSTGARDFFETAAVVAGLDEVITVDTSVAHLAGAMGKPLRLLLPQRGLDWRWMERRDDSPWYPTARLWRQTAAGDWGAVVERLTADL